MIKYLFIFNFLCTFWGFAQNVDNPWQQKKGELLLSPYHSYYFTNQLRNLKGNKKDFDDNGYYENINPRIYFSTGLGGDNWNLFGSIPFVVATFESDNVKEQNKDFGEIELGLRKHLYKTKNHYAMLSLAAFIPAYKNDKKPFVGLQQYSLETRFHLGGSFSWLGKYKNFHKLEVGTRIFSGFKPVQLRVFANQGYKITDKVTVLGEFDLNISMRGSKTIEENQFQLTSHYNLAKVGLNVGYNFTNNFSLFVGAFHDVWNRNTSIGKGVQLFSIINLDY